MFTRSRRLCYASSTTLCPGTFMLAFALHRPGRQSSLALDENPWTHEHQPLGGGFQAAGPEETAGCSPTPSPEASSRGQAACASVPGKRRPPPAHHGQTTVLGSPPRFEITLPLPRQAIHSRGSCAASSSSSLSLPARA